MSNITPKTIEWSDDQVATFNNRHHIYEIYAGILQEVLSQVAMKYAPDSIVQARAKEVNSFAGKIWRKKDKSIDPVNEFTDLCGGRVITNNQDGVKSICSYIESHFDIDWENSVDISQRLKPSEFGYRSIHYIVRFKKGIFPNDIVDVKIPDILYPDQNNDCQLKAEIQVRTILEHSWADFSHRISYKRPFKMPPMWEREMARMAAFLEEADNQLVRIQKGLRHYLGCYSAYMKPEEMEQEIQILENVLRHDPGNAVLADEIGRLAMSLNKWDKAVLVLKPYLKGNYLPAIRDYGDALCNQFDDSKHDRKVTTGKKEYLRGQRILHEVLEKNPRDIGTLCILAGTYRDVNDIKARELYQKAFEIEPDNPYPLSYYLDYMVIENRNLSFARSMQAIIRRAYQKSRDLANAGLEAPWSYFNMGKFSLFLEDPYDAIRMYVKGCSLCTSSWPILLALRSLRNIESVKKEIPGFDIIIRFIKLYLWINFQKDADSEGILKPVKPKVKITEPTVIVAGGTDVAVEAEVLKFTKILTVGVQDFGGTIISGGTFAGVCRIVGDLQEHYGKQFKTIGYLPKSIPSDIEKDKRYSAFRSTDGEHFSPLEAIQYWEDIIGSGISPKDVRLVGINGGKISGAEYRIALAFKAKVGILSESGNEASRLFHDPDWIDASNLLSLPLDPLTIRAFFGSNGKKMRSPFRDTIGQMIHREYLEMMNENSKKDSTQKNLFDWEELPENLKESNREQADHILNKLKAVGYEIRKATAKKPKIISFTEEEVEFLSEMEHGRWNVERLRDGWKYGIVKDVSRKISPYLLPWEKLSEEVKEYDRDAVRKIPKNLTEIGLEIFKK